MNQLWTTQELDRLRALYPQDITKAELMAHFPGRTWYSVAGKACRMGLHRPPNYAPKRSKTARWTREEDALLRRLYVSDIDSAAICAQLPGRTWSSIRSRARMVRLKRHPNHVSPGLRAREITRLRSLKPVGSFRLVDGKPYIRVHPARGQYRSWLRYAWAVWHGAWPTKDQVVIPRNGDYWDARKENLTIHTTSDYLLDVRQGLQDVPDELRELAHANRELRRLIKQMQRETP